MVSSWGKIQDSSLYQPLEKNVCPLMKEHNEKVWQLESRPTKLNIYILQGSNGTREN